MAIFDKGYRLYGFSLEKLLKQTTTKNSNNSKSWRREKSDFQSCHIVLFKISSFYKKKIKLWDMQKKRKKRKKQSIETVPEETQILNKGSSIILTADFLSQTMKDRK